MTEELLNVPDIGSLFKQMCRKAVPQSMYCGLLSYVCFRSGFFEKLLYASRAVSTAGSGLYMDERATMSDLGKLDGGNIIGYDPYDKKLHWFSVDNFGTTHDHIGEVVDKDHLRLVHESQREGKLYKEVIDVVWKNAREVHMRLVGTLDGQIEETLEGMFVRKSQK